MMTYPQVKKADIERWVGSATFEEGVAYEAQRTMANVNYSGMRLEAECLGPMPHIYEMEVVLDAQGIFDSRCDCPAGGACKHVTALLLTWLDDRDASLESSQPTNYLAQRSKEELIALINQMVKQTPNLSNWFDVAPKSEHSPPQMEPEMIRQQVTLIMSNYNNTEMPSYRLFAKQLLPLVNVAHEYAKAGDWCNAATVYEIITRGVLDEKLDFMDDEHDFSAIITHCIMGLGKCLNATLAPTPQEKIEHALFDIYHWKVRHGGIQIRPNPTVLLLTHSKTSPSAKERLATWTRVAIENSQGWQRHDFGGFLLELSEPLSDEAYLRICYQTGRIYDLVNRLLDLGRVTEAEVEAGTIKDYYFMELVNLFVSYNHATIAERLVRQRIAHKRQKAEGRISTYYDSHRLYEWLKKHAREQGQLTKLFEVTQQMFLRWPNWSGYQEVKKLAHHFGRWDTLRPNIIAHLYEKRRFELLSEIYLSEQDVDQALATVVKIADNGLPFGGDEKWLVQVAQAAELHHPGQAIDLYIDEIHRLIKNERKLWVAEWEADPEPGWDSHLKKEEYMQAVTYLMRVHHLYLRLGNQAEWQTLIEQIRRENRNRTQLIEQLDKVGL